MSKESIVLSLRELIDAAFGDYDTNTVNFNLVKTVMFILARQLRLLERQVEVESNRSLIEQAPDKKSSSLSVTEVKIQTKIPPKKGKNSKDKGGASSKVESDKTGRKDAQLGGKDGASKSQDSRGNTESQIIRHDENESIDEQSVASQDPNGKTQSKSHRDSKSKVEINGEKDEISKIERILRIINQRSDSREEGREVPSPMSTPVTSEKIFVVKTKNQEDIDNKNRTLPKISVVSQEQFDLLVKEVNQLRNKHTPLAASDLPETKELMKQLKKQSSLSESIVALQLSARLEAAEKALERMISLVTFLAQHVNTDEEKSDSKGTAPPKTNENGTDQERRTTWTDTTKTVVDHVTYPELDEILQELKLDIEQNVEAVVAKNKATTDNALKVCNALDSKLSQAILVEMRMGHLEHMVDEYTQKINILDTSLSSQMTHYQEMLTQMEHDLEAGIENMAEALANAGGDTTAISELNAHFSALALDFDNMAAAQRELRDHEHIFNMDIQELWRQVEYLKEAKSDRDEVEDALRDKAGLDALNGLTTMMQFEAVRGDLEKRIGSAYDKFNSQEYMWQKAIDDLIRELNEKAHIFQLETLRDELNNYLNSLKDRLEFIANIVGEPSAAGTTRMVQRNTACISCSMPAHIAAEQSELPSFPGFPARKKTSAQATEAEGAGDYIPCIPGKPIPHRTDDIRIKICTRYCGGEHTKTVFPPPMPENALHVAHVPRESSLDTYEIKQLQKGEPGTVPCLPCNYYPDEQIKEPCSCGEVCKCFLSIDSS